MAMNYAIRQLCAVFGRHPQSRREEEAIACLGVDEKSFRRGHNYITSAVDLEGSRVLEVVEERTEVACRSLLEAALTEKQRSQVEAVALDMWPAFASAVEATLEKAVIVHDRFHVSKYLNEAVDLVRRQENKELSREDDHRLKGSRYLWLMNAENVDERFQEAVFGAEEFGFEGLPGLGDQGAIPGFLGIQDPRLGEEALQ